MRCNHDRVEWDSLYECVACRRDADESLAREMNAVVDQRDTARAECDKFDIRLGGVHAALTAAGMEDWEEYPDEPVDEWERSLRTGGRMIPIADRVKRLATERDTARAEVARLRSELASERAKNAAVADSLCEP